MNCIVTQDNTGKITTLLEQQAAYGADNAITAEDLSKLAGCTSRKLRQDIQSERSQGALILSAQQGLFLPSKDPVEAQREVADFCASMEHRARSIFYVSGKIRERQQLPFQELMDFQSVGRDM